MPEVLTRRERFAAMAMQAQIIANAIAGAVIWLRRGQWTESEIKGLIGSVQGMSADDEDWVDTCMRHADALADRLEAEGFGGD